MLGVRRLEPIESGRHEGGQDMDEPNSGIFDDLVPLGSQGPYFASTSPLRQQNLSPPRSPNFSDELRPFTAQIPTTTIEVVIQDKGDSFGGGGGGEV